MRTGCVRSARKIGTSRIRCRLLVAVRLGIGNVILLLDQRQVVLPHEHVRYRVNILDKRTDYTDTANIVQIIYHGLQRDREIRAA